jgi:SOS response regulatory protein OraA/RecX
MRAQELREAGISAQTIARAVENGEIERISRGFAVIRRTVLGRL